MNAEVCLSKKSCVPCRGGVPSLNSEEIKKFLNELSSESWFLNDKGHLCRTFVFEDFLGPVDLVNKITVIAEQEGHHPDLKIAWGSCEVEIWTHKINGLTESDFILAAKINEVTS